MNHGRMVPQVPAAEVPADARLVDVREHDEWAAGHAPDAVHIPLGEFGARYTEIPSDGAVYLICRSGARSNQAAHALSGAGWEALNVADGMIGWHAAGRAMECPAGSTPFVA